MDPAYYNWLWLFVVGAVLGVFFRPRTVVRLACILEAIAIGALVASAAFSSGGIAWIFGLVAMAIPILGAVIALGGVLGSFVRSALHQRAQK